MFARERPLIKRIRKNNTSNKMSITKNSQTNIELCLLTASLLADLGEIVSIKLANEHDLSQEQFDFWMTQRNHLLVMAQSAVDTGKTFCQIKADEEKQSAINALVPFINGRNPLLN